MSDYTWSHCFQCHGSTLHVIMTGGLRCSSCGYMKPHPRESWVDQDLLDKIKESKI